MEIEHELGELTGSIQVRWNQVLSPVVFVLMNEQDLVTVAQKSEIKGFKNMLDIFPISDVLAEHMPPDFLKSHIPEQATKKIVSLTETVLSSALVFGHAVLEDVIMQTLALCHKVKPEYFYEVAGDKSIKIKDVRSGNFQSVLDAKVAEWFKATERDTLLAKMRVLFACLKPNTNEVLKDYFYDEARLIVIDKLRHEVVHKKPSRAVTYNDLQYLRRTTIYAAGLLQMSVGVSLKSILDAMHIPYDKPDIVVGGPRDTDLPTSK